MPRLKLTIAYVGTLFAGWQLQLKKKGPQPRTVQGVLEAAVQEVLGEPARLTGAGRTDSGVHAEGQVAHLDVPERALKINWREALNRRLPDDVTIRAAEFVDPKFNARHDAKAKIYIYSLWLDEAYIPPRVRPFAWGAGPLDLEAMDRAAEALTGEHDFAAFRNSGAEEGSSTRKLYSITREPLLLPGLPAGEEFEPGCLWPYWAFIFHGSGFLKQMVRNLMGLLVGVGLGKIDAQDVPSFLELRERKQMPGATAPGRGLTLYKVLYE